MRTRFCVWGLLAGLLVGCSSETADGPKPDAEALKTAEEFPVAEEEPTSAGKPGFVETCDPTEAAVPEPAETEPGQKVVASRKKAARPTPDPELPIDLESQRILDNDELENIENVIALLKHKNPRVRRSAVNWLDRDPLPAQAIKPLAERLNDRNLIVSDNAADALAELEEVAPIREELIAALDQDEWSVLRTVLLLLQKLPEDQLPTVAQLTPILQNEEEDYARAMALEMIARMGRAEKPPCL